MMQQNSRCILRSDRDEPITHIESECWKLVQEEYKTRHDCVGKVIHWELSSKFRFVHTNKWYMSNQESVLENGTHKLLYGFEIQMDHQISARRLDVIITSKKRTYRIVDFVFPADHRVKLKESEKKDKYLDLSSELKKIVKHGSDGCTNCNWCFWYSYQRIGKRSRGPGIKRTSGDNPNYSIAEICQNTDKSPGDSRM